MPYSSSYSTGAGQVQQVPPATQAPQTAQFAPNGTAPNYGYTSFTPGPNNVGGGFNQGAAPYSRYDNYGNNGQYQNRNRYYGDGGGGYRNNRYNRNQNGGDDFKFTIVRHIAVLKQNNHSGWARELNVVAWNNLAPCYDIREWSPDHHHMNKGLSFKAEEIHTLYSALSHELNQNGFNLNDGGYSTSHGPNDTAQVPAQVPAQDQAPTQVPAQAMGSIASSSTLLSNSSTNTTTASSTNNAAKCSCTSSTSSMNALSGGGSFGELNKVASTYTGQAAAALGIESSAPNSITGASSSLCNSNSNVGTSSSSTSGISSYQSLLSTETNTIETAATTPEIVEDSLPF